MLLSVVLLCSSITRDCWLRSDITETVYIWIIYFCALRDFSSPACSGRILEVTKICYFHIKQVLVALKPSVFSVIIKINKTQPSNIKHSQNSLLNLFLFSHSDSYLNWLCNDFVGPFIFPGQFLMVSTAQMSTNIGHSELRAEEETGWKKINNKSGSDLYSLGYLCNGSMNFKKK